MNMVHCQCDGIEGCFDTQCVANERARFRKRGMATSTRLLVEALRTQGIEGLMLLDVGGGVGAVIYALLQSRASVATDVDASAAYLATARDEAERQGLAERIAFHHGDFVVLAPTLPTADIVTIDRVICCYVTTICRRS
jgi:magnesium-protoporphyrin O-methyltransferase